MVFLSGRLEQLAFSQTMAVIERVARKRAEGRDIISLGAGEIGLPIPEPIRRAAAEAALRGEERSPPVEGLAVLRRAIAAKFERDNALAFRPEQVIVGNGSKQVIYNAFAATLNDGEEVVIPAPYWVSYPDIVRLSGGRPRFAQGRIENGYKITPAALDAAITPRTRWLILNSPHNPTGSVYSAEELSELAEILRRHRHVFVLSDDIYEPLTFAPARFATLAAVAPDLAERVLTVNGFSKRFSMIGWRIGYAAGPLALIEAMGRVQSQVTSGVATITQAGALAALAIPRAELDWIGMLFATRRERVVEEASRLPGIAFPRPDGAFYLYLDVAAHIGARTPEGGTIGDDVALADYLLEAFDVVTLPGSYFGTAPALRLSYTCPDEQISEAFARIGRALASLDRTGRRAA